MQCARPAERAAKAYGPRSITAAGMRREGACGRGPALREELAQRRRFGRTASLARALYDAIELLYALRFLESLGELADDRPDAL